MIGSFIALGGFAVISALLVRPAIRLLKRCGITAPNYRGERIPTRTGVYIWLMTLLYMALFARFPSGPPLAAGYGHYAAALTLVFAAGWLDDAQGGAEAKGLRGHAASFLKRKEPTSGLLKALCIAAAGFWLASRTTAPANGETAIVFAVRLAASALVMALSANAVNLLDLRPGRALKAYLLLLLPIVAFGLAQGRDEGLLSFVIPVGYGALLLLPGDARGRWMLGDTGANVLGFALGYGIVRITPWWYEAVMAALFLLLHWTAETSSLTRVIDRYRPLRWLDRLGRA